MEGSLVSRRSMRRPAGLAITLANQLDTTVRTVVPGPRLLFLGVLGLRRLWNFGSSGNINSAKEMLDMKFMVSV